MQLDLITPRVERLSADGAIKVVHEGGALGRLRRPVVLLARDLCAFELFETSSLPRSRRRQAARLHARIAAPYVAASSTLVKAGNDFGVWWWDQERVEALLAARDGVSQPVVQPETLAQPRGAGWRIVRLAQGYEAQLWRAKALVASAWRRDRYDGAAWSAFVRLQRAPEAPPEVPPAPDSLPLAFDSEAFAAAAPDLTREQLIGLGMASVGVAALSLALFQWGQGLKLSADAELVETETAEIRAATPQLAATRDLDANQKRLVAYRQIEEQTNPVSAVGAAIGVLALHDLAPTIIESDVQTLSLTLPYDALEKVDVLIAEFGDSGYFHDIEPRADGAARTLVFTMKVREAAPPLAVEP